MTDSFDYRDCWGVRSPSARPAEDPEDFWASPDDAENRRLQEWQQREERQAQQRVAAMRSALKTLGLAPQDPDDPGALAQDEAREQAGARAYMHAKAETRRKFVEAEIGKMSEGPPTARGLEATRAWLNRHKPELGYSLNWRRPGHTCRPSPATRLLPGMLRDLCTGTPLN